MHHWKATTAQIWLIEVASLKLPAQFVGNSTRESPLWDNCRLCLYQVGKGSGVMWISWLSWTFWTLYVFLDSWVCGPLFKKKVFNLEERGTQFIREGGAHDDSSSFGRRGIEARFSAHALSHHVIPSTMLTVQHEGHHQIQYHLYFPASRSRSQINFWPATSIYNSSRKWRKTLNLTFSCILSCFKIIECNKEI